MLKFRNPQMRPMGGRYFYRVPETGVNLERLSMDQLLAALREHYALNSIPAPAELPAIVEDYMCARLPEGFCTGTGERKLHFLSLHDIRENTLRAMKRGLVDPAEAKRRLSIVMESPTNDRALCTSCAGLVQWAKRLVNRPLPGDEWLGVSTEDFTALTARIHFADDPAQPMCWSTQDG